MKLKIIKLLSFIGCFSLRLQGVVVGKKIVLSLLPKIKKFPGSTIQIKDNVTIHSLPKLNPVLNHRTYLATLSDKAKITLGKGCGISGATIIAVNEIHIGEETLIGADCLILDNDMHYPLPQNQWGSTIGEAERGRPIHIGKGCFIGARAIILKGVNIADGSVVAAGAVVTRDVPRGCLAIGNPAQNVPLPDSLKHPN